MGSTAAVSKNGKARLTKEELADRTRFRFKERELDLPEIGGSILLKSLSVGERESLPDLVDADGKPDVSIPKLAALFAAVVVEPNVSPDEAQAFIADWPADALDKLIVAFGEMSGTEEEAAVAAKEFRSSK